jgi:Asp-tRNA(Asn)/Glu-tRNA(Gln) amidotransferase C subunit
MTVTRAQVEHIAKLAALALDEATLPDLTRQIGQILEYVSRLETVEGSQDQPGSYPGPLGAVGADGANG